jgi:peptidoglycan L-alanyl-D-glutamate endopeptidase CwlK
MISSRKITDLRDDVQVKCLMFLSACEQISMEILITSTFRDLESQDVLYAQGRTAPGKIVTNARAGQSFHNWRVAFDFVPLVNGKPAWEDINAFNKCGEIAESLGLEWAGRWEKFRELAHCQFTNGKTLKDFQSEEYQGGKNEEL